MPRKDPIYTNELQWIEIAIELDRGRGIQEISEQFGVKVALIRKIARNAEVLTLHSNSQRQLRISKSEKEILLGRIENGEDLEELAAIVGVKTTTLQRWCRIKGIAIPRNFHQLSVRERKEIREMLEIFNWKEVARAYNLNRDAIEELREPAYRKLDAESLAYLFELLKEQPKLADSSVIITARKAGLELSREAVDSYRKRLKKMKQI